MGLFSNKSEGALIDIIRCDEEEYLVWKWRPSGYVNSTKKENAISYGSSLRVKESEMAVFFYQQNNGVIQDYIIGPNDQTITTANFPILSSIVGTAFGGNSPFQAEIYFINLSGNIQIKFGIPYFDVFDPRFPDLGVPCSVRGNIIFNITDYKSFIKLNKLINFSLEDFKNQIKDFFIRKAKSIVLNITAETGIPAMQLETRIDTISDYLKSKMVDSLTDDFGINLKRVDIGTIELDKEHSHYQQLKKSTVDQQTKLIDATTDIEITNRLFQVQGNNFNVHQLNQQTEVLKTASENLGQMSNVALGGGVGLNPAGLMMGMGIGSAMGSQINGMVNMNNTPPPPPKAITYHISTNGQQFGPYNLEQLKQMIVDGQFNRNYYVWKEGMSNWELAEKNIDISSLFSATPPPPPQI